ncbi:hypothetical protein AAFF_G00153090 [Aldrovandia affinis]|uniref:Uncharacterized protein n=1 Tax=Aldrovandia affinis TaxID=143900 RepID=A0AAD7R1E0_9TELE|nr:hypothetical protein AAFF_G00153090 [Aldrovandia affinis]
MPSEVQSELARDQFIRALPPLTSGLRPHASHAGTQGVLGVCLPLTASAADRRSPTAQPGARPTSPEVDDITVSEPTVVVGRAGDGDSCYVPVTIEGVPAQP